MWVQCGFQVCRDLFEGNEHGRRQGVWKGMLVEAITLPLPPHRVAFINPLGQIHAHTNDTGRDTARFRHGVLSVGSEEGGGRASIALKGTQPRFPPTPLPRGRARPDRDV